MRDETWSLILRPGDTPDELYNLKKDPKEKNNVIDAHRDVAARLASAYGAAFAVTGHKMKGLQGSFEVANTAVE